MGFPAENGEINGEYLVIFLGLTCIIAGLGVLSHIKWRHKPSIRRGIWIYLIWSLLLFFCMFGRALWDIEQTAFLHYWSLPVLLASSLLGASPHDLFQPLQKIVALLPLVLLMPLVSVGWFYLWARELSARFSLGGRPEPLTDVVWVLRAIGTYGATFAFAFLVSRRIRRS